MKMKIEGFWLQSLEIRIVSMYIIKTLYNNMVIY